MVGCFYIPHLGKDARSPENIIGTEKQHRPLVIGQSTPEEAEKAFANRHGLTWSADRRYAVCKYPTVSGYFVFPLCFEVDKTYGDRVLRLTFDPAGHLQSAKTYDEMSSAIRGTSFENQQPHSDGLR